MKVLLIEPNDFHEEVILSQLEFLKESEFDVFLFLNERLKNKIQFNEKNICYFSSSKFSKFLEIFKLLSFIKNSNIDLVIFNSYENKFSMILSKLLGFLNVKQIAIAHNVDFYYKRKIKELNGIFVLNKYIKDYIFKNLPYFYKVEYFLPLIKKECNFLKKSEKYIVIPGLVEFTRRDYMWIVDFVKENYEKLENIKFVILGNISKCDGPKVLEKVRKYKIEDKFLVFNNFIPYDKYFEYICKSDAIMPLIHPSIKNYKKYKTVKITAAFTMAFSFKKPLILYKDFEDIDIFKNVSFFYQDKNELLKVLYQLKNKEISGYKNEIYEFKFQKENYLNFLKEI